MILAIADDEFDIDASGIVETMEYLEHYHDVFSLVFVVAGGALALFRYFESGRLERAQSASRLIESFAKDPTNQIAMRLLDWTCGNFSISLQGKYHVVNYDPVSLVGALRIYTNGVAFKPDEQIIRDVMDYFLSDLGRFGFLIKRGVIDKDDFWAYFSYWLKLLSVSGVSGRGKLDKEFLDAIWLYIYTYEFDGVTAIFSLYGLTPASTIGGEHVMLSAQRQAGPCPSR